MSLLTGPWTPCADRRAMICTRRPALFTPGPVQGLEGAYLIPPNVHFAGADGVLRLFERLCSASVTSAATDPTLATSTAAPTGWRWRPQPPHCQCHCLRKNLATLRRICSPLNASATSSGEEATTCALDGLREWVSKLRRQCAAVHFIPAHFAASVKSSLAHAWED